jgi:hypothetical protein
MSYYEREATMTEDGKKSFTTEEDMMNEELVADILREKWRCELHSFGTFAPIDWYAVRDNQMTALIELKSRSHSAQEYPTVFLNVRKWLALTFSSMGLRVPAIFVVKFSDEVRWIDVAKINTENHKMGGTLSKVKSVTDVEPVLEIPVGDMKLLEVLV